MRNRQPSGVDTAPSEELEGGFVGVNDNLDPALLGQGLLAMAENVRCYRGFAETRPGTITPIHFNPDDVIRWYGGGLFSNPNGIESILAAVFDGVWMMADGRTPCKVPLAAGLTITSPVEFTQAFTQVILWREGAEPLLWTGDQTEPFKLASTVPARPSYLATLPNASYGVTAGDRVWFPVEKDEIGYSDLLDYTHWDPALARFRINQGESGNITALHEFRKGAMLVFKERCTYLLEGLATVDNASLQMISPSVGCLARRTVTSVGGDVIWLADNGVFRLREILQNSQQASAIPVSQPIAKTMARINWNAARGACAELVGRYWFLSVPLDQSTVNNAILVYDVVTEQWQGVDTFIFQDRAEIARRNRAGDAQWRWSPRMGLARPLNLPGITLPTLAAANLVKARLFGRDTAFLIDGKQIIALGHGNSDKIAGQNYPIKTVIGTRGLSMQTDGAKALKDARLTYSTHDADWSLVAKTDGVKEVQQLVSNRRRNRLKYKSFGLADWNPDNAADDFTAPHRQDYAWRAGDGSQLQSGIPLQDEQEYAEGWPLRGAARWVALAIESKRGRFILKSIRTSSNERASTGKNKV